MSPLRASNNAACSQRSDLLRAHVQLLGQDHIRIGAERARRRARRIRLAVQTYRRGENGHWTEIRMLKLVKRAALMQMRVGHDFVETLDDPAEQILRRELLHDFRAGLTARPLRYDVIDLFLMLATA